MKYSRQEKRLEASKILEMIHLCKNEADIEKVDDYLDACAIAGIIFKIDYKFLCEELDDRLMTLVEEGVI
jgi:hypothetical protein